VAPSTAQSLMLLRNVCERAILKQSNAGSNSKTRCRCFLRAHWEFQSTQANSEIRRKKKNHLPSADCALKKILEDRQLPVEGSMVRRSIADIIPDVWAQRWIARRGMKHAKTLASTTSDDISFPIAFGSPRTQISPSAFHEKVQARKLAGFCRSMQWGRPIHVSRFHHIAVGMQLP
jgi:hypothetical protein